jgi:hypothetical protein
MLIKEFNLKLSIRKTEECDAVLQRQTCLNLVEEKK